MKSVPPMPQFFGLRIFDGHNDSLMILFGTKARLIHFFFIVSSDMIFKNATKPLVGLGEKDVMEDWGAAMSIYSDLGKSGKLIARMIADVFGAK